MIAAALDAARLLDVARLLVGFGIGYTAARMFTTAPTPTKEIR